ncbi:MAG: ABC transporter substrate-binding protein, partial [Sarcina sp.]
MLDIKDDSIVCAVESIPKSLNSTNSLTISDNDLICSIFEGLVEIDENGNVIPSLSEGWKVSDDKLEYTFILKKDIKWSDGTQIKAKDFVEFFKESLSPKNKEFQSDELDSIYGVKSYRNGQSSFDDVAIKNIDDFTILIRLNNPDDGLLSKLAKPQYRLRDLKNKLSNYLTEYNKIKYSGPYIIEYINKDNTEIKLCKNKFYLNNKGLKEILLKKEQEKEIDFAAYNIGKIDIMKNPPLTSYKNGSLSSNVETHITDVMKILIFNGNSSISGFLDFRKGMMNALNLEIEDSYILKNNIGIWNVKELNYLEVVEQEISKNIVDVLDNYDKRQSYYTKAAQLFSAINMKDKFIKIVCEDTLENQLFGEFIKELLKLKYSIEISLNFYEQEKLNEILKKGEFDIYLADLQLNNKNLVYDFIN